MYSRKPLCGWDSNGSREHKGVFTICLEDLLSLCIFNKYL